MKEQKTQRDIIKDSFICEMQSIKVHEDQDDQLSIDSFDESFDDNDQEDIPEIQSSPLPEIPMATDHEYEDPENFQGDISLPSDFEEPQYVIHQKLRKTETKIRSFPEREIVIGCQKNFRRIYITNTFCKVELQKKHPHRRDVSKCFIQLKY